MLLNRNTAIVPGNESPAVGYAVSALRRDILSVFDESPVQGGIILLELASLPAEAWRISASADTLTVAAGDDLGFIYGLFEVSRRLLGVQPFWFWNDQRFEPTDEVAVPAGFACESRPARVRYRGWFINDETLLTHWKVRGREDLPFVMAFEALLRLGGNMVIPGTGPIARKYRKLASDMGLIVTHHHAEPLGAEMFVHACPELEPAFSKYPDRFRALWREGIDAQKGTPVIWNTGFRGQGDCPFWDSDPRYDTPDKRGALISSLIREQYELVRQSDPGAVCCTNLYGETMELYQAGCLNLPGDVIKIWADNGYGKMVSRRQGNDNPRVPALPEKGDSGLHGLYYHASFYDLQAASHITMLPNSGEFVRNELTEALARGADQYWLINCSNIKPHTYLLDLIACLWRDGDADAAACRERYAAAYYGHEYAAEVADCLSGYAVHAVAYGSNADEHAGDQFYHHVPRMLISQFLANRAAPSGHLRWLCDFPTLPEQTEWCAAKFAGAQAGYDQYLRRCEVVSATLSADSRTLFQDTILLQAALYSLWAQGAAEVCAALRYGFAEDWKRTFYHAGRAKRLYSGSYRAMTNREHGKWAGFYANECQTDVRQTAVLCGYLMSFARNMGEGPHFYQWMREFQDSEEDRRIMLLLNTERHPEDDELWLLMEQCWGK